MEKLSPWEKEQVERNGVSRQDCTELERSGVAGYALLGNDIDKEEDDKFNKPLEKDGVLYGE
jgi:hypothetical protein